MNITFLEDENGDIEFHDNAINNRIQEFYQMKF